MRPGDVVVLDDQGDGWWHSPRPLRCTILDGPSTHPESGNAAATHILVDTDEVVEWHGDPGYRERWGPDHALCRPMVPTHLLLVLASSDSWTLNPASDWSVLATPVVNDATTVAMSKTEPGLTMKVRVVSPLDSA